MGPVAGTLLRPCGQDGAMEMPRSAIGAVTSPRSGTRHVVVDTRPLSARVDGTLTLSAPDRDGRSHVSAASGIAQAGGATWVVSDEYGELARFDDPARPGTLLPGLARSSKHKPDLEAMLRVPNAGGGALLVALGSGSKPNGTRDRALAQPVDAAGQVLGAPIEASLGSLYDELDRRLPLGPNVEGVALRDGAAGAELLLFHRGKLAGDVNAVFRLDAARALDALRGGRSLGADLVLGAHHVDLGMLGGERLGFADAVALEDGSIAFVASAEGEDGSGDGPIKGSVIGLMDANFTVRALRPLDGPPRKVEGILPATHVDPAAPASRFTLVTDADDPTVPSEVLSVDLA